LADLVAAEPRPQGKGEIAALLARHGLRPDKRLGQHFLADPNLVERVVRAAELEPGDRVLEIGAGTGTLTRALAAAGAEVVAYEVDGRLRPVLEEALAGVESVEVRFADATREDFSRELSPGPWVVVANLPYQVGTPLVLDLLRNVPQIERFVVMVQREVADRLAAAPGSRRYGIPSVVAALYAEVGFAFAVPPQVFLPPPDVESAVVTLRRRAPSPYAGRAEQLAHAAFNQRRKMIRRSLATTLVDPEQVIAAAGLDPTVRAEMLSPDDYVRLAQVA
jgi:16S rRNA (adenine1518-N6/adenine1519-N6)-dimethyltransferase